MRKGVIGRHTISGPNTIQNIRWNIKEYRRDKGPGRWSFNGRIGEIKLVVELMGRINTFIEVQIHESNEKTKPLQVLHYFLYWHSILLS